MLRRVHKFRQCGRALDHLGLSYVVLELVQLVWGRTAVPFSPPVGFAGLGFTVVSTAEQGMRLVLGKAPPSLCGAGGLLDLPAHRGLHDGRGLAMLLALWLLLTRTRVGLVIQAALTHAEMVEALGHNVPRVMMLVFGGGCALAALAGSSAASPS